MTAEPTEPTSDLDTFLGLVWPSAGSLSVCWQVPGDEFAARPCRTTAEAAALVREHAPTAEVWVGVCPIADVTGGRGKASDVLALPAVWVDLDVKPGAFQDKGEALAVVAAVDALLGSSALVVDSGGGLQARWLLDTPERLTSPEDRAQARATLRRFRRLVIDVAAETLGREVHLDNVSDLARVLRAPNTYNRKGSEPRPTSVLAWGSEPDDRITLERLTETLAAQGIALLAGDLQDSEDLEPVAPAGGWAWADRTSRYVDAMVAAWWTDTPPARHPWLLSCAVRLACAHRLGQITEADAQTAYALLARRFQTLTAGEVRKPREVPVAFRDAVEIAERKTEAEAWSEIGGQPETWETFGDPAIPLAAADVRQDQESPEGHRRLVLQAAAEVTPRPVEWLWEGRLALGSLGLLAGREGLGKSLAASWLAAQVSTGTLPGQYLGQHRAVLVVASEDDLARTVRPRLEVAGADLSRVHFVAVQAAEGYLTAMDLIHDLRALERAVEDTQAALVIFDPLISRLGSNLDSHKDAEVRLALEPLVAMASRAGAAVLGLIHLNKGSGTDALDRVMGSRAFTAVARSVTMVVAHPEEEGVRLLGTPKNNLGRTDLPTLTYQVTGAFIDTPEGPASAGRLVWGEHATMDVGTAMAGAQDPEARSITAEATDWLREYLEGEGGAAPRGDVVAAAQRQKFTESTLKRAAKALGIQSETKGGRTPDGRPTRTSVWSLPERES